MSSSDLHDFNFEKLSAIFREECRELLEEIVADLLKVEGASASEQKGIIGSIFRGFHTIKGNAYSLGADVIEGWAHQAETLLDTVRSGASAFSPSLVSAILGFSDEISAALEQPVNDEMSPQDAEQGSRRKAVSVPDVEKRIRILVVDGQFETRKNVQESLPTNFLSRFAVNGSEALDAFRRASKSSPFDIVFVDLDISRINGLDLVRALRAIDNSVLIIATAGYSHLGGLEGTLMHAGADVFLRRPFSAADLHRALQLRG